MPTFTYNKTVSGDDFSTNNTLIADNIHLADSKGGDRADAAQSIAAIRAARYQSFISYSSDEIALARRFAALLNANTPQLTPVFFAEQSIAPGQNWYDELIAALDTIEFLFVIFSDHSFAKHFLHVESGMALAHKKRIIPVLHGALAHNSLKFPYRLFQSSLRLDEGDEKLVTELRRLHPNT
jgi:hypothetical protein